jgi:hypothetical protein
MSNILNLLYQWIGSHKLSYVLIGLFILQATFIALLTTYIVFDERFHFGIIEIYTNHWWPVIYNQPTSYDTYRDFAGEGSKLYHFLMSFPMRGIELFTQDQILQLKFLRLTSVGFVAVGLYWFYKLFDLIKIKRIYSNLAMFIFIMIPVVPWVSGAVNYDNFVFMLTPMFFYVMIKIIRSGNIALSDLLIFTSIGLTASLAKFTFIPIFGLACVAILYYLVTKKSSLPKLVVVKEQLLNSKARNITTITILSILLVLFAQTYVINIVKYGTPRPECQKTLGVKRCLNNSVIKANESQKKSKDQRPALSPVNYTLGWMEIILTTSSYSAAQPIGIPSVTTKQPIPGVYMVQFIILISTAILLIRSTSLRNSEVVIMATISLLYILFLLFTGYVLYEKYHSFRATQARYLLPQILLLLTIGLSQIEALFTQKVREITIVAAAMVLLVAYSQGGGVWTYIINSEPNWYWDREVGERIESLQEKAAPFIKE